MFAKEFDLAKNGGYYPEYKVYKRFPKITGCPPIKAEKYRPYIGRALLSRQPAMRIKKAPRFAYIRKIINYPWRRMGSPQICLKGNKGTGKSVLLNLIMSFLMARGIRVIMFDNSRFESRNLAPHGYFDKKNEFHPYEIDIWIPEDYEFKKKRAVTNPLWQYRNNVHKREYNNLDKIVDSMESRRLTVIYDECFTDDAKLKIFSDLLLILAETAKIDRNYLFAHHELASLIPENPTKETYKLIQKVSAQVSNIRKDRIGILTSFHLESEIFYRIVRKFSYICHKQPENKTQYTPVERDALKLKISQTNISRHGFWMTHDIGYFAGLPDMFRLIPQRTKINYPSMKPVEKKDIDNKIKKKTYDDIDFEIARHRARGLSYQEISEKVGRSKATVYTRAKKMEIQG